jgi:hypothetical protein
MDEERITAERYEDGVYTDEELEKFAEEHTGLRRILKRTLGSRRYWYGKRASGPDKD